MTTSFMCNRLQPAKLLHKTDKNSVVLQSEFSGFNVNISKSKFLFWYIVNIKTQKIEKDFARNINIWR